MHTVLIYSRNANSIASINTVLNKNRHFRAMPATDILEEIKQQIKDFSPKLIILDLDNRIEENTKWIKNNCDDSIELIIISDNKFFNNNLLSNSLSGYINHNDIKQQLELSLKRVIKRIETKQNATIRLNTLLTIAKQNSHYIISLESKNGIEIFDSHNIISISAKENKSEVKFRDNSIIVNKLITEFEIILQDLSFFRIHRSHIINLLHIRKYIKKNGGNIEMNDDSVFSVSAHKKAEFSRALNKITLNV